MVIVWVPGFPALLVVNSKILLPNSDAILKLVFQMLACDTPTSQTTAELGIWIGEFKLTLNCYPLADTFSAPLLGLDEKKKDICFLISTDILVISQRILNLYAIHFLYILFEEGGGELNLFGLSKNSSSFLNDFYHLVTEIIHFIYIYIYIYIFAMLNTGNVSTNSKNIIK